jgi:hypothetical protein
MKRSLYPSKPSFFKTLSHYTPFIIPFLIVFVPFILSILLICHEGTLPNLQGGF